MSAAGPRSRLLPSACSGRHVAGRAHDRARLGQHLRGVHFLGQAEIGDLGRCRRRSSRTLAGFRSRWTIWRSWAACMARLSVSIEAGGLAGGQRCAVQPLRQAAAGAVFQREEGQAVVFADLVDLDDVGMLQAGDRFGLGPEALQLLAARDGAAQDHLEGDQAFELGLLGLVDDAHAAAAQFADEGVARDGRQRRCDPRPVRQGRVAVRLRRDIHRTTGSRRQLVRRQRVGRVYRKRRRS